MSFAKSIKQSLTASILSLGLVSAASAGTTTANYGTGQSTEGLGSFSAVVTYTYTSGTTASLTVLATNNTSALTGGYITAIALKGSGVSAISFVSSSHANFGGLSGSVSVSPYGTFQGGSSTSSSWLGGGSPNGGIAIGQSSLFTFTLSGSAGDLASRTAASILEPAGESGLAVRFRGMSNGGSDKILGTKVVPVPAPGAACVLVLAGMAQRRRR